MIVLGLIGCIMTRHPTETWKGPDARWTTLEQVLAHPVELEVEVFIGAEWQVPLSGLLDLNHPKTEGFSSDDVEIALPVVRVRHPEKGTFFIDSGIDQDRKDGGAGPARGLVAGAFKTMKPLVSLKELMAEEAKVSGILLTHLHLDHVLGLPDVPLHVPIYIGPGEGGDRDWKQAFAKGTYAQILDERGPLQAFDSQQGIALGPIQGAVDVVGDGSIWALPAPGHTLGSTAYFLNAKEPILVLGDASHTCWGWEHGVSPGTFSHNPKQAEVSFQQLRRFAAAVGEELQIVAGHILCDAPTLWAD